MRFLVYFLFTTLLFANPVGSVTSLSGGARLFTKGEIAPKNATANVSLAVGQTLTTRLASEAGVKFIDNTKVIVVAHVKNPSVTHTRALTSQRQAPRLYRQKQRWDI